MSDYKDVLGGLFGGTSTASDDRARDRNAATLRKLLQQAVDGERRALKRATEAEAVLGRTKKRAQNNIDRAFNRGVSAAGGDDKVRRIVRHPEFGVD